MRKHLLLLTLLFVQSVHAGEWRVRNEIDSMTDRERKVAIAQNDTGHSLSIYRMPDDAVWVNFSLPKSSGEVLATNKWLMYRVDKETPRNLDDERRLQRLVGELQKRVVPEPKWLNFMIWDGKVEVGRSEGLIEFMDGESVTFRYYLFTGGFMETTFSLTGASPAIADALGLTGELKSGSLQRVEAVKSAMKVARKSCESNAVRVDFSVCFEKVKACAAQANENVDQFQLCARQ